MTKNDRLGHLNRGPNRRSVLGSAAAFMSAPFVSKVTSAWAQEKLTGRGEVVVFSYGGSYTQGVRKSVYEPFTKATGIAVVDVTADIAEPQVRAMNRAGRVDWDVALIDGQNYPTMHEAGFFSPSTTACGTTRRSRGRHRVPGSMTQSLHFVRRRCSLMMSGPSRREGHKIGPISGTSRLSPDRAASARLPGIWSWRLRPTACRARIAGH